MDGLFCQIFAKSGKGQCACRRLDAPGGGGIFSKYLENRPLFSKYLEKRPIHIFLIATFLFFQITIIYKGTQVTSH